MQLTHESLFLPTSIIQEDEYKEVFRKALRIADWVKTRKAYAVAANQLGVTKSFFVAHRKYKKWNLPTDIYMNPSFTPLSDKKIVSSESCLSFPNQDFNIERYYSILLKWYDPRAKEEKLVTLNGLPAIICQHEITHLLGIDERTLDIKDNEDKPDET